MYWLYAVHFYTLHIPVVAFYFERLCRGLFLENRFSGIETRDNIPSEGDVFLAVEAVIRAFPRLIIRHLLFIREVSEVRCSLREAFTSRYLVCGERG